MPGNSRLGGESSNPVSDSVAKAHMRMQRGRMDVAIYDVSRAYAAAMRAVTGSDHWEALRRSQGKASAIRMAAATVAWSVPGRSLTPGFGRPCRSPSRPVAAHRASAPQRRVRFHSMAGNIGCLPLLETGASSHVCLIPCSALGASWRKGVPSHAAPGWPCALCRRDPCPSCCCRGASGSA